MKIFSEEKEYFLRNKNPVKSYYFKIWPRFVVSRLVTYKLCITLIFKISFNKIFTFNMLCSYDNNFIKNNLMQDIIITIKEVLSNKINETKLNSFQKEVFLLGHFPELRD